MKDEMHALIGKDNHIWGFFDSYEEAKAVLMNQSNFMWYHIEKIKTSDYFGLDGQLRQTKWQQAYA